jgi:ribosome-binding protein aMBF1 (putative translation factor)
MRWIELVLKDQMIRAASRDCISIRPKPHRHQIQRQLGDRIRKLRQRKGWSQEEFGAISGIHRTYIGAVERGEKNLTIVTLHTIAKTLDTSLVQLFRGIA